MEWKHRLRVNKCKLSVGKKRDEEADHFYMEGWRETYFGVKANADGRRAAV